MLRTHQIRNVPRNPHLARPRQPQMPPHRPLLPGLLTGPTALARLLRIKQTHLLVAVRYRLRQHGLHARENLLRRLRKRQLRRRDVVRRLPRRCVLELGGEDGFAQARDHQRGEHVARA